MVKTPISGPTNPIRQPNLVFYRVPVLEALKRGNREELVALVNGARELQKEYGTFDKMIATLDTAAKRAGQG